MTDNSSAEKAALQETWPTARHLLCHFHVAQAEWRWLTAAHNGVHKDQRRCLMSAFQEASLLLCSCHCDRGACATFRSMKLALMCSKSAAQLFRVGRHTSAC